MYNESKHVQVTGTAVAVTGGAANQATLTWLQERSITTFQQVPTKKKLVITDFVYHPQGDVAATYTINIAESTAAGDRIMLQLFVNANESTQGHFLTGFVVASGSSVKAWTDANAAAGKHVSLTLNGYVAALGSAKGGN
jgi:hypothetical protein